ncbi:uncharacterized protein FIBRA_05714 [Fibroporia radiculosa]|uniref:GIT Spa2 homology (SHD) domain-containing protein n=1 Tax=Fibroporia radiculosa TaxID=599839 RepID=J4G9Z5_9APHY|nr:uncharacterized protein FIBRA_05714 [Fibroporia radiculosa]CCM03578.1 predicted protein [Fibroporia radiculosa]
MSHGSEVNHGSSSSCSLHVSPPASATNPLFFLHAVDMKRSGSSRVPSPTNTTYSGISNYRTESYRPIRDALPSPFTPTDPYAIARTHFDELSDYLADYLAKEPANSRTTARQKLTRLTRQQFQELSTDVYDELVRRKKNADSNDIPFLPVRDDFHPKRNQARQKLATLPTGRFKDLSSDVYYELARRYPEFKEDSLDGATKMSPGSTYDDYPSPDFPASARSSKGPTPSIPIRNGRASEDRAIDSGYAPSPSSVRRPSEDSYGRRRLGEDDSAGGRRSADTYGVAAESFSSSPRRRPSQDVYRADDRRRPSQDTSLRRSEDREREYGGSGMGRRPSEAKSTTSESTAASNAQSAGMGMIIPNKSTIAEEEIEVPYGREVRDSASTAMDDRTRERERSIERGRDSDSDDERRPNGGLSGLSARLQAVEGDEDGAGKSGDDYFDKMSLGRTSVTSDRSAGGVGGGRIMGGRASVASEEHERIRREYEYRIATMQSRITTLERDLEDVNQREQKWTEGEERVRAVEEEMRELRQRLEEKSTAMFTLQQELDNARQERAREKEVEMKRAREDEEELQILRDRCERLEAEREGQGNSEILDQLRSDTEGLLVELSDLSRRNDELMTAKDADLIVIRDLDAQLKDYKRKYEQAKTELRSVKATSQLFLQAPRTDDQLPVSPDGGLADIHVTAFVSAIDSLLTAGRSNAPTRVLTPMKAVVNAVSAIVEDIKVFEQRRRRDRSDVDMETLRTLRERVEATLSNLVAASKTHATGSGMSPVSLLDAAASHVSLTVTEIGKTICIRKATRAEQEQFSVPPPSASVTSGFAPSLRSVDEVKSFHQRGGSSSSSKRGESYSSARMPESASSTRFSPPGRSSYEERRGPPSNRSSSDTSSPPPIFDQPASHSTGGVTSDESGVAESPEDAWAELKPYLEAQTEAIVYAIQSVLSGVRSPTPPPTLNENLTQIITIVSSIVAVCKDNLPPSSAQQGEEILRELGEHANKLSEVQAMPEVTKESRQVMAKSSFAVANAMKGLMKL